ILKVKPIGLRDNFFDLGGHSLTAARLLTRIEQSLGREIPLESMLEAATIEQQAQLIRDRAGSNGNVQPSASYTSPNDVPVFYLGGDPTFQPLALRLRAALDFHNLGIQASIVRQLKNPYSLRLHRRPFRESDSRSPPLRALHAGRLVCTWSVGSGN